MAKFIPDGWRMSLDGERRFNGMRATCLLIVKRRIRKYNLPGHDPDDLIQEGMLAAAYAVDTFNEKRGKLEGYISRVVFNALAMVACSVLAKSRQPHKQVQDPDGTWRNVPIGHVELEHDTVVDDSVDPVIARREVATELAVMSVTLDERIAALELSDDAKQLLAIRINTPPELWIMSRNMNRGRMDRLSAQAICLYFAWMLPGDAADSIRYQRAVHELRVQFRVVLGVDDTTFEPIDSRLSPHDARRLQLGAKRRDMKELRR